jgi:hypothetical protein
MYSECTGTNDPDRLKGEYFIAETIILLSLYERLVSYYLVTSVRIIET